MDIKVLIFVVLISTNLGQRTTKFQLFREKLNAVNAWKKCQDQPGGVLATIQVEADETDVYDLLDANITLVWLSLYHLPEFDRNVWMDGACTKYTNVEQNKTSGNRCVVMLGGMRQPWQYEDCERQHSFVCRYEGGCNGCDLGTEVSTNSPTTPSSNPTGSTTDFNQMTSGVSREATTKPSNQITDNIGPTTQSKVSSVLNVTTTQPIVIQSTTNTLAETTLQSGLDNNKNISTTQKESFTILNKVTSTPSVKETTTNQIPTFTEATFNFTTTQKFINFTTLPPDQDINIDTTASPAKNCTCPTTTKESSTEILTTSRQRQVTEIHSTTMGNMNRRATTTRNSDNIVFSTNKDTTVMDTTMPENTSTEKQTTAPQKGTTTELRSTALLSTTDQQLSTTNKKTTTQPNTTRVNNKESTTLLKSTNTQLTTTPVSTQSQVFTSQDGGNTQDPVTTKTFTTLRNIEAKVVTTQGPTQTQTTEPNIPKTTTPLTTDGAFTSRKIITTEQGTLTTISSNKNASSTTTENSSLTSSTLANDLESTTKATQDEVNSKPQYLSTISSEDNQLSPMSDILQRTTKSITTQQNFELQKETKSTLSLTMTNDKTTTQSQNLINVRKILNSAEEYLKQTTTSANEPADVFMMPGNVTDAVTKIKKFEESIRSNLIMREEIRDHISIAVKRVKTSEKYNQTHPLVSFATSYINSVKSHAKTDEFLAVAAHFLLPKSTYQMFLPNIQNHNQTKLSSNIVESLFPIDTGSVLSITALSDLSVVNASVSFSFNVTNDLTYPREVARKVAPHNGYLLIKKLEYICSFVDVQTGKWNNEGCKMTESLTPGLVQCYCSHTTLFSVLLSMTSYTIPSGVKLTTFVAESISVLFLLVCLTALLKVRKKIRQDRIIVQINLTFCLLVLHAANLFHDAALGNYRTCEFVAVSIHVFLLASVFWMFLEGITLILKTRDRAMVSRKPKTTRFFRFSIGYGIPGFIVLLATLAGFTTDSYLEVNPAYELVKYNKQPHDVHKYNKCWLSPTSGVLLGSVVVPIAVVLSVNVIIIVRMTWFVHKMSYKTFKFRPNGAETPSHFTASVKAFVLLLPVLGIPWMFAFLAGISDYETSVTFMYLNSIINGTQGLLIFIIYCVIGSEVRGQLIDLWKQRSWSGVKVEISGERRSNSFGRNLENVRKDLESISPVSGKFSGSIQN